MALQIAESRREPTTLVQSMFVDAQYDRALGGATFPRLTVGELVVDALDGGRSHLHEAGQPRAAHPIIVKMVDGLAQGLRGVPTWANAWKGLHEAAPTLQALIAPAFDHQSHRGSEAAQVLHPPFVAAFAVKMAGSAVQAALRALHGFGPPPAKAACSRSGLPGSLSILSKYQLGTWGPFSHFGLLSPIFDEEPECNAEPESEVSGALFRLRRGLATRPGRCCTAGKTGHGSLGSVVFPDVSVRSVE